jgi:hypothetical protein
VDERAKELLTNGFVVVGPDELGGLVSPAELAEFRELWNDLPPDEEMADGGTYRQRRYGRLRVGVADGTVSVTPLPHAPFRQDAEHIPLYEGRERMFPPAGEEVLTHPAMRALVSFDVSVATTTSGITDWLVNVHLIRIVARQSSPGLPTPEGRHRDGHAYVGMHLMRRECDGGNSIVYRDGHEPTRFTMRQPLDSLMVDDHAVMHEVTPIAAHAGGDGVRDMLLVDLNPA